jgi:hypothetical protein
LPLWVRFSVEAGRFGFGVSVGFVVVLSNRPIQRQYRLDDQISLWKAKQSNLSGCFIAIFLSNQPRRIRQPLHLPNRAFCFHCREKKIVLVNYFFPKIAVSFHNASK